jgi:glycine oxidase
MLIPNRHKEEILAEKPDVVVVGAGVMGCSAAYWLSKEGYKVLILEKESIAVGASGMATAHLQKALEDERLSELTWLSFQLHQELARVLPQESGIDIGYREQTMIELAFSVEEVENLRSWLSVLRHYDPSARWLEGQALWEVEPRLNRDVLGGLVFQGAQVMAYRFVLALVEAAEHRGMELRHGEVVGLRSNGGRVTGVQLRQDEIIDTEAVVLAMGPWSQRVAEWVGLKIPVYPVRGQLLELLVPDPQLCASPFYSGMYLLHKADGVTLAGTTYEPDSGFANHPTPAGLEAIINAVVRMAPSLEEAQVADHISGLRPASGDSLPLIGPIPGWQGLYIVSGHDREGVGLSLISTRIIADLIAKGHSPVPLEMFDPARFGSME